MQCEGPRTSPHAGENGDSGGSDGPAHKPEGDTSVSSMSGKHGDKHATGSGPAPTQIRVGMESSGGKAGGGDAALRALVQKLPDLSYMLSDTLVLPARTR